MNIPQLGHLAPLTWPSWPSCPTPVRRHSSIGVISERRLSRQLSGWITPSPAQRSPRSFYEPSLVKRNISCRSVGELSLLFRTAAGRPKGLLIAGLFNCSTRPAPFSAAGLESQDADRGLALYTVLDDTIRSVGHISLIPRTLQGRSATHRTPVISRSSTGNRLRGSHRVRARVGRGNGPIGGIIIGGGVINPRRQASARRRDVE